MHIAGERFRSCHPVVTPCSSKHPIAIDVEFKTASKYPVSVKILVDDKEVHKTPFVGPIQPLHWELFQPM